MTNIMRQLIESGSTVVGLLLSSLKTFWIIWNLATILEILTGWPVRIAPEVLLLEVSAPHMTILKGTEKKLRVLLQALEYIFHDLIQCQDERLLAYSSG